MLNKMKLLVSDYDNTIVTDHTIEKADYEAIQTIMKEEDKTFVIASGRAIKLFYPAVEDLKIPFEYAIMLNGAIIADKHKNIIYKKFIDASEINKNLDFCLELYDKYPILVVVTTLEDSFFLDDKQQIEEFINRKDRDSFHYIGMCVELASQDIEDTTNVCQIIREFNSNLTVVMNNWFIDLLNPEVSKGNAIRFVMDLIHANINDLYVIGDSYNDIPMFELTNHSYTFTYSPEAVKKEATHVVACFKECADDFLKG